MSTAMLNIRAQGEILRVTSVVVRSSHINSRIYYADTAMCNDINSRNKTVFRF